MPKKTTIGKGLGKKPSRLLEFGEAWKKRALILNLFGIETEERVGKPKISWFEEAVYVGEVLKPLRIEIDLKGIDSTTAFGFLNIELDILLDVIRLTSEVGFLKIILDKGFIENLEEEEVLIAFAFAA